MNTFDEIIQTKAFSDLTPEELEVISELVSSEEEYNEMKSFFGEINQLAVSSREEVSGSVKSSLNSVFQAKHPGITQNWSAPNEVTREKVIPLYNQNWFRVAALLVVSAGITTMWISFSENQVTDQSTNQAVTASTNSQSSPKTEQPASDGKTTKKELFPIDSTNPKTFTASSEAAESKTLEEERNTAPANFPPAASYSIAASDKIHTAATVETWGGVSTFSYNNNQPAKSVDKNDMENHLSAGMDADLNPMKDNGLYSRAENPGISTDDLLSLIEPSF